MQEKRLDAVRGRAIACAARTGRSEAAERNTKIKFGLSAIVFGVPDVHCLHVRISCLLPVSFMLCDGRHRRRVTKMRAVHLTEKREMLYDAALALTTRSMCGVRRGERRNALGRARVRVVLQGTRVSRARNAVLEVRRARPWQKCRRNIVRRAVPPVRSGKLHRSARRPVYEVALRAAVLSLKREPHIGRRVAHLLLDVQQRPPLDAATRIIPVPLHQTRERERGFNQAAVLGHALAALSGLPCDDERLVRVAGAERHRAGMDARGRRESVEGAFDVRRQRLIEGERVLLIDDVFTTGATVSACAKALRTAGAEEVFVLTIARA